MSKYDTKTAAAIERQLARRYKHRQQERAWAAERQRVMGYVALGSKAERIDSEEGER